MRIPDPCGVAAALLVLLGSGCAAGAPVLADGGRHTTELPVAAEGPLAVGGGPTTLTTHRDDRGSRDRVAASSDRVWEVLPGIYQELGLAVGTRDPQARALGNRQLVFPRTPGGERLSRALRCGEGATGRPIADDARVSGSILTFVHPQADGSSLVETQISAVARGHGAGPAQTACTSTGRLEQRIARMVAERAAPGS
jgi:hypothetical protein